MSTHRGPEWARRRIAATALGLAVSVAGVSARAESSAPSGANPEASQAEPPPPPVFEQPKATEKANEPEAPPPPPPRRGSPRPTPEGVSSSATAPAPEPVIGRVHDGFYLRLSLGGSYGRISIQTDRVSQPDVTQAGFGGALDVWGGYTVSTGIVVGPAFSFSSQRTNAAEIGGEHKSGATGRSALFAAFIDAYPNPRRGEHFGGLIGLSTLTETTDDGLPATDYDGGGLGLFVFAGYDAWLAPEWSLGGVLRLGGVATQTSQTINAEKVDKQGVMYEAALLATAVYH